MIKLTNFIGLEADSINDHCSDSPGSVGLSLANQQKNEWNDIWSKQIGFHPDISRQPTYRFLSGPIVFFGSPNVSGD